MGIFFIAVRNTFLPCCNSHVINGVLFLRKRMAYVPYVQEVLLNADPAYIASIILRAPPPAAPRFIHYLRRRSPSISSGGAPLTLDCGGLYSSDFGKLDTKQNGIADIQLAAGAARAVAASNKSVKMDDWNCILEN